jgi:hypothetical protein
MRQGPHHGAHRSTRTGRRLSVTVSKSASVASTSHGRSVWHEAHLGVPLAAVGTRFRTPQERHGTTAALTVSPPSPVSPIRRIAQPTPFLPLWKTAGAATLFHPVGTSS